MEFFLSTSSSWRFFKWAPEDEENDESGKDTSVKDTEKRLNNLHKPDRRDAVSYDALNHFQTPQKRTEKSFRKSSPPMSPSPYVDTGDIYDTEEDERVDSSSSTVYRGILYASNVIEAGPEALKILAFVLGELANSPVEYLPAHERD